MKSVARVALIAVAVLAGAGRAEDLDYYRNHYPSSDLSQYRPAALLQALRDNVKVWHRGASDD